MKLLLPHRFKKIGIIIAPVGIVLWLLMQKGFITQTLAYLFGRSRADYHPQWYHVVNVMIAIISFFSFLGGLYLIAFSKEKIEDEMIQRTRLDSFQFAAMVQIITIILGFIAMLIYKEPGEGGLMLFFVSVTFFFWICFIGRFNYIVHVKLR